MQAPKVSMPELVHVCPRDFVSNGNISNISDEAFPLRNKLEYGEPQASGILSPSGRHTHSPEWSRVSGGTLGLE